MSLDILRLPVSRIGESFFIARCFPVSRFCACMHDARASCSGWHTSPKPKFRFDSFHGFKERELKGIGTSRFENPNGEKGRGEGRGWYVPATRNLLLLQIFFSLLPAPLLQLWHFQLKYQPIDFSRNHYGDLSTRANLDFTLNLHLHLRLRINHANLDLDLDICTVVHGDMN